jgi:DNA-dependent RNA polymerase auxiliary subunit epsilon
MLNHELEYSHLGRAMQFVDEHVEFNIRIIAQYKDKILDYEIKFYHCKYAQHGPVLLATSSIYQINML